MTRFARYLVVALVMSGALGGTACAWAQKPSHANGSGSTGGSSTPIVSFQSDVATVAYGGSVTLSWAAANAQSCDASGAWSGKKSVSGTERVDLIKADAQFVLTCRKKNVSTSKVVNVTVDGAPAPSPSVSLTASPETVEYDGTVVVSWAATNADSCEAYDGWSGTVGVSGNRDIGPLEANTKLSLRCLGEGGTTETSVLVQVQDPAPAPSPTVTLNADATSIDYEGSVTLQWSSLNADSCTASGGWLGDVGTAGTSVQGPLYADTTFSLSCTGQGGTAIQSLSVAVASQSGGTVTKLPAPADVPVGTLGDGGLESMVASYRQYYGLPAMAVVVTHGDQIAEWAAVGKRRIDQSDPVTLQDRWHLGSMTKALTATLAGVLVDKGKISWDTRVVDIWPGWKGSIRPAYENVTVKQLASHTSGLPDDIFNIPSINQIWDDSPGTVMDKRELWAKELLGQAPAVSTGSFLYSNGGYIVLGAMLEAVSGISWEDLMRTYVYDPLGMTTAGFGAPDGYNAWGHRLSSGKLEPVAPGPGSDNAIAMGPAATAHASLGDYAAFMVENLRGARGIDGIVTAKTAAVLQTPVTSGYALGWAIGYLNSSKLLGHTGSNGNWLTLVWVVPDYDVGIFIAVNSAHQSSHDAIQALQDKLLQRATGLRW